MTHPVDTQKVVAVIDKTHKIEDFSPYHLKHCAMSREGNLLYQRPWDVDVRTFNNVTNDLYNKS